MTTVATVKTAALAAAALFFLAAAPAIPASPTTYPSGAALIRKVRADEAWIDDAKSFQARFKSTFTHTPLGIANNLAELRKASRGKPIDPAVHSSVWPEWIGSLELAFDATRYRYHDRTTGFMDQLHAWDGRVRSGHEYYPLENQRTHVFSSDRKLDWFFDSLDWARAARHDFWITRPVVEKSTRTKFADAERYEIVGRDEYRGVTCDVVVPRWWGAERWYIGVEDGRLRGTARAELPADVAPGVLATLRTRYGGPGDDDAFDVWFKTQPAAVRFNYIDDLAFETARLGIATSETWMYDYTEVAPGRWFPMTQGRDWRELPFGQNGLALTKAQAAATSHVTASMTLEAESIEVDHPLAATLFERESIPDGVEVQDGVHKPFLTYTYKHDMTAAEWQKALDAANARQAIVDQQRR